MSNLTPYHQRPLMRRAEARQLGRTLGALEANVRLETAASRPPPRSRPSSPTP